MIYLFIKIFLNHIWMALSSQQRELITKNRNCMHENREGCIFGAGASELASK